MIPNCHHNRARDTCPMCLPSEAERLRRENESLKAVNCELLAVLSASLPHVVDGFRLAKLYEPTKTATLFCYSQALKTLRAVLEKARTG